MENATKALLIAAAVLIVILVIAFGMRIFNTASSTGDADDAATTISTGIDQASSQVETQIGTALENPTE